jgi:hypothetical protein
MLNVLSEYVSSMVAVSIIVSIVMTIAPKGAARAAIGVVSGLVIMVVLLGPLAALRKVDFSEFSFDLGKHIISSEENLLTEQDNLLKELIVDKTSAYILAKAQALEVDCEVIVTLDDSYPPLPAAAVIKANIPYNPAFHKEMSAFLAFDCGIPRENQSFIWK